MSEAKQQVDEQSINAEPDGEIGHDGETEPDVQNEEADMLEEAQDISEEEKLRERIAECEDRYYRLAAEYDNYKKRTQREKDARYADALIDAAAGLLPVIDNLERAAQVEVTSEDAKKVLDGVAMVLKQINDAFAKMNITPIEALGKEFNPELHNAVMHMEDEELGENIIAEELMKGYIYKNERVVRHSMVKVAN